MWSTRWLTPLPVALWLCAVSCARREAPPSYEGRAFVFAFERGGQCLLTLGPERFGVPAGSDVIWEIRNECGVEIEPEVHDFVLEGALGNEAPAAGDEQRRSLGGVFEPGQPSRLVGPNGTGEIRLRIRRDARQGRYNYGYRNLRSAGAPGDPKVDIWPPI
jgi:hypothetical protein